MRNFIPIIAIVLLLSKTVSSQNLSITDIQRDSIVSKILRGEKAEVENKILKVQVKKIYSVIKSQDTIIKIQKQSINIQKDALVNSDIQIKNLDIMVKNEIKIGRSKGRKGFFKGLGIGAIITLLLCLQ